MRRESEAGRLRLVVLSLLLLVLVAVFVAGFRARFGVGAVVSPTDNGACRIIEAPAGPEDMEFDGVTRRLVVSATDRRRDGAQGALWVLDVDDADAVPRRLEHDGPAQFRPHGLSLHRDADGLHAWVVNHTDDGHRIEGFTIEGDVARHRISVAGDALVSPNDVAAVDARRFYVSNDHGAAPGIGRTLEDLLGLNLANVAYFDGSKLTAVLDGLSYANGVVRSASGSEIAVAEVFARAVTFADVEPNSGRVGAHLYVELDSGVDNLTRGEDGSYWVTGHTRILDFVAHARDPAARSPTEVFRIERTADGAQVERVFVDDGALISGGSVAVPVDDRFYVAGVFQPRIVVCPR